MLGRRRGIGILSLMLWIFVVWLSLAAHGASPAAFGRRCIPPGCVAPRSNIPDILARRALPAGVPSAAAALGWSSGRIAALGATPDLHHGPLGYGRVGVAAPVSAPAQSNEQLQIEKGRQAVGQACVPCHTNILRIVQIHGKSAQEWRDTVYSMIGRGAQILPEEIEPLTAFLAANSGAKRPSTSLPTQTQGGSQLVSGTLAQQALEAEGKSILQRDCLQCHDLEVATQKPATEDWKTVISKMVTYGAKVTPGDQQKLIEYLNGLTKSPESERR